MSCVGETTAPITKDNTKIVFRFVFKREELIIFNFTRTTMNRGNSNTNPKESKVVVFS